MKINALHFYGDSLTAGYGAAPAEGWISRISKKIRRIPCYNHGVCGAGFTDICTEAETIINYPAPHEALFLMGGTNDLLCGRRYDSLIREAEREIRTLSEKLPLFIGTPPLTTRRSVTAGWQAEWQFETTNAELARYADFLRNLAAELSLPLFDFQKNFPQDDRCYADGVHPNADGYRLFAETAEAVLSAFLA